MNPVKGTQDLTTKYTQEDHKRENCKTVRKNIEDDLNKLTNT